MAVGDQQPREDAAAFDRDTSLQERQGLLDGPSSARIAPLDGRTTFNHGEVPYWRRPLFISTATNLGLILLWYFFGTFLSLWNKLILGKERGLFGQGAFPAPFMMSSLQFFSQHFIARGLLSSGLVQRRVEEPLSWKQYVRTIVPNGISTGLDIGFSNYSLVFITLSFYVMCKSTSPLFLLLFAFIWGIEKPSWSLGMVVVVITCGLLLLVAGETQFNLLGFILVMSASALSGLRWTITQVLLQGNRHHASAGGPIEVICQLTPIMGVTLGLISLAFESLWTTLPTSPYFATVSHAAATSAILLVGGLIAFCMVWAEFTLISNTSALTFMVAGTFKEIVTVGAAVLFLHEEFTAVNAVGLAVLVGGVVLFNYLKYKKLKQGDIIPVPLEDGMQFGGGGGGGGGGIGSGKGKELGHGQSGPVNLQSVAHGINGYSGNGGGSGVELVGINQNQTHYARPPSPHALAELNLRRVHVLHEDEDGMVTQPTPGGVRRQQSI